MIKTSGNYSFFPISSELMLVMRHPENGKLHGSAVVELNENSNNGINVRFWPDPLPENAINNYNNYLFELSDRFVVSNSKEVIEKSLSS